MVIPRRRIRRRRGLTGARTRTAVVPDKPAAFGTVDEMLEAAKQMFFARKKSVDAQEKQESFSDGGGDKKTRALRRALLEEQTWTKHFHRSFSLTGDEIDLCRRCRKIRLNRLEREILVAVVLHRLALVEGYKEDCASILRFLNIPGDRAVEALRCMSEDGRLYRSSLIMYEDKDEDLRDRDLVVDPVILDMVLLKRNQVPVGWGVKTEKELYVRLAELTAALHKKAEALQWIMRGRDQGAEFYKHRRRVERLIHLLDDTLALHRAWGVARLLDALGHRSAEIMMMALVGKELGHLNADDELFLGTGLARAASNSQGLVEHHLKTLGPGGVLAKGGFVQPCGGDDVLTSDDPRSIEKTEFELTEKSLELLNLDRKLVKRRNDAPVVREAKVRMDQLALSGKVRKSLAMAGAQAKHAGVLVKEWGLGDVIAYGRAVTLMFSGPPGVGKTACAEAMAHELGKPILVADYASIQNCYVGVTEKNIVRTFREARKAGAVLFWDEADAMFFDRNTANKSWEVRDVNVLLQELEKYEGVCILATNRKLSLDQALERRISLKVEFERPDGEMRRLIWQKLMPKKMPTAQDVDLDRLSEADLTGGEIKNVVLNAARMALARGAEGPVRMGDFLDALELESGGRWSRDTDCCVGFKRGN